MSKIAQFPSSIAASRITYKTRPASEADHKSFIAVALFCGIGLLISLVAMVVGVQGAWF
jgi:hypothetical protein